MTGQTLRLEADDMWTLLEHIDLVEVIRDGLRRPGAQAGTLSRPDAESLTFHDAGTGQRCDFPVEDLRGLRLAGLTALAAHLLLTSGVITASVVGPRRAVQWQLGVIGRFVPDVSHVAALAADAPGRSTVDARVLDQLDLNGIGLSVAEGLGDTVFGATLVVALGPPARQIGFDQLAAGSLLVTDATVAEDMRDGVARRYAVDDLCAVPTGGRPARNRFDDVVLVELREPDRLLDLDTALAHRLSQTALALGA